MNIIALVCISTSELQVIKNDITYDWINSHKEEFEKMLYDLGMEVKLPYEKQEDILHRNRLNKIVQCDRWVGNERTDKVWITSGYASQSAIDKSKNSRLLIDLYRNKGQVE